MTSLLSSIFTALGRLLQAVSGLYWMRIIFLLICVSFFLFYADIAQVLARNPRAEVPGQYSRVVQPHAGKVISTDPDLAPGSKKQNQDIDAVNDDEQGLSSQEPGAKLPVQDTAIKPTVQATATSAETTQESKDKVYEIIIEKNIFSPDRKKWVSEVKKSTEKMAKKEINELVLLGTVISKENSYAVLRTKKDAGKEGFKPSMKGDYVQGYLVIEIEEKKVTLHDDAENTDYVLFINDDKKERVAEKTAVKTETAKAVVDEKKTTTPPDRKRRSRRPAKPPSIPAEVPDAGRKAVEQEEPIVNNPEQAEVVEE